MQYGILIFWQNIVDIKCIQFGIHPILINNWWGNSGKGSLCSFPVFPPHQENQKQYHDRAYTLTTATIRYDCVYYILLTCLYAVECLITWVPAHEDTTSQTFDASFCRSLILVGELWKRVPWFFSTIPPFFFYSRTIRVYVFSNAWSRDSDYSCKHSTCHAL